MGPIGFLETSLTRNLRCVKSQKNAEATVPPTRTSTFAELSFILESNKINNFLVLKDSDCLYTVFRPQHCASALAGLKEFKPSRCFKCAISVALWTPGVYLQLRHGWWHGETRGGCGPEPGHAGRGHGRTGLLLLHLTRWHPNHRQLRSRQFRLPARWSQHPSCYHQGGSTSGRRGQVRSSTARLCQQLLDLTFTWW